MTLIAIIERGQGRSGHCRDYVLSTVAHLEELGVDDARSERRGATSS